MFRDGVLDYHPNPSAVEFHNASEEVKVLWGPMGCLSGDSLIAIRRGARTSGSLYALRDAYREQHGLPVPGKGSYRKWEPEIPTYTLSLVNGAIVHAEVEDIVVSGVKETFVVTTEDGRYIRATRDHRFRVPVGTAGADGEGFVRLEDLGRGDTIICRSATETVPDEYRRGRSEGRRMVYSIPHHPFGWKHVVNGFDYKRMGYAQLVIEAEMNGLPVDELLRILRHDPDCASGLRYLPPDVNVHHRDLDVTNDRRENLEIVSGSEHSRVHVSAGVAEHFGHTLAVGDTITSIEPHGEEETFDVVMRSPNHNFVANGFVVHNSGKTSAVLLEYAMLASESVVPLRGIVIRSTFPELRDSTLATWTDWFGEVQTFKARDFSAFLPLPHPKNGKVLNHQLDFRSCQRVEDVSKLLSTEYGFAFLEECVPAYQSSGVVGSGLAYGIFEMVTLRLRQKGIERRTICVTFNPPFPSHWCHREFLEASRETLRAKDYFVKKQPPLENEKNLPNGYYDRFDRLDPDTVRRFKYGEVVNAYSGVRVFPEVRDGIHVIDHDIPPLPGVPLTLGFDFGRTQATLVTQIVPSGQWRWIGELQTDGMGTERHTEILRTYLSQNFAGFPIGTCYADPSGEYGNEATETTSYKVLAANGFAITPGIRELAGRLEPIKQMLLKTTSEGEPMILISRHGCPLAAEAMAGGYRFPKSKDGIVGEKPLKNLMSHIADAAQYIASREFPVTGMPPQRDQWGRPLPAERKWGPLNRATDIRPTIATSL